MGGSRRWFGGIQVRTPARFQLVGTKGEDVVGEAGLDEGGFVGRYGGGGGSSGSGGLA